MTLHLVNVTTYAVDGNLEFTLNVHLIRLSHTIPRSVNKGGGLRSTASTA